MGSPYLKSGETIVLTTNRVSADAVPYDVMLTTERIFLIDNRNARFEPRIIPLSTILSVQGGTTPAHDPVIMLLFRTTEEGDAREPLNLVFSQSPNENRKSERDDWVKTLIQLSIAWQERIIIDKTPAVPKVTRESGLRPTTRHGVAPEMVRPLSNVVESRILPAPVAIIPDEGAGGGEIPVRTAAVTPASAVKTSLDQVPEEPAAGIISDNGTPQPGPAPMTRVIIPQIIEELLPARTRVNLPVEQVRAPLTTYDHETWDQSFRTAVRSLTVTEEPSPKPLLKPGAVTAAAGPVVETVPEDASAVPPPTAAEPREVPEIIRALDTGAGEPVTTETTPATGPVPEPSSASEESGIREIAEPQVTEPVPENDVQESVDLPASDEAFRDEIPPAAKVSQIRYPLPPAREIRPLKTTFAYTAILILLVALVAAAVLLLPQGLGNTGSMATPIPETMLVTTVPPATMLPATVPSATTRITTPVPSLPVSPVPQTGVWVRVNSTAYYFGTAGNPELMQPVSGTGDNFYKVLRSDRPVQVSVQKQDNSGAMLAVAIYRNGTLISTRSVTSPMGAVDLLIDPITARPPGLTANDTLPEHAAPPTGLENY
jgi:hypothetical protein